MVFSYFTLVAATDIVGLLLHSYGYSVLECDAECALIERNRRLALALEIKNPDLGNKLGTPSFSDFLKDFAK